MDLLGGFVGPRRLDSNDEVTGSRNFAFGTLTNEHNLLAVPFLYQPRVFKELPWIPTVEACIARFGKPNATYCRLLCLLGIRRLRRRDNRQEI